MKTIRKTILGVLLTVALVGCNSEKNDELVTPRKATPKEFSSLKESALEKRKQEFKLPEGTNTKTFTSTNGVEMTINRNSITQGGSPVTGEISIVYTEIFKKGDMLVTNKPTMGRLPNGKKALLLSGGEFYIQAHHNGQEVDKQTYINMAIPTNLTTSSTDGMILWDGVIDEKGDLTWEEQDVKENTAGHDRGVIVEGSNYYSIFRSFGWTNVDKFYSDSRPKTTLLASVPEGYDNNNCAIYLSYDGEGSSLAHFDTYDPETKKFSEHYGQIPIGIQCHVIFATAEGDNWKYAVKAVTIEENGVINFTEGEMETGTEDQLAAKINALP